MHEIHFKFEARISKFETNYNFKNIKFQTVWNINICDLVIISDFGFRISDLFVPAYHAGYIASQEGTVRTETSK